MASKHDETIVVTGGAGGIGSAVVRKYASLDTRVIIGDIDHEGAGKLVNEMSRNVHYIPLDVLDYDSIREFTQTIKDNYGTVSHLVSLAGGAMPEEHSGSGFEDISLECMSKSIDLNLKSHLYIMKELLPLMKEDPSPNRTITLISSINALRSIAQPAYSAAKAGLLGLVRATTDELGKYRF